MRCPKWLPACSLGIAATTLPAQPAELPAPGAWRGVQLREPQTALAVRRALHGAARRLGEPRCREVFSEFRDPQGRPLAAQLAARGTSAASYLGELVFREGWTSGECHGNERLAFTRPGSRTVWVCGGKFEFTLTTNARWAEATLIHEALHTLGLGEGPPSSLAVTRKVVERCGR